MGFKHFNIIAAILLIVILPIFGEFFNRKPFPTYSLHNMPRTSFSCRDKILGGYYADAETQCQMFHVCVKVAGVGIQDFRFLCPNGTAFDQEAQICADWGDVDCEEAILYYGSDNFDLYRIGSGFENKRAPLAEEEEATFHLQRAETSDARRSKQTIVNQSIRPDQPPIYRENTERNFVQQQHQQQQQQQSYNDQFQYQPKKPKEPTIQKPVTTKKPYYQKPAEPQYSNPGRNNNHNDYQSESRNDDELLKGSHSSNFFNNRNNGKEDDLVEFTKAPTKRPVNRGRQRARNPARQNYDTANRNNIPTPPSKTTTTFAYQEPRIIEQQQKPKITTKTNSKTLTLQTSFRTADLHQYDLQNNFRNSTLAPPVTSSTTTQRYNLTPTKPQTQQNIQPTTYNPSYNPFKTKSSTTISFSSSQGQSTGNHFYNVQYEKAAESSPDQFNRFSVSTKNNNDFSHNDDVNKFQTTTQNYNNFAQKSVNNFGKFNSTDINKQAHSLGEPINRRNDDQFFRQTTSKPTKHQNFDNNNNYQIPNTSNLPLTVRPLEARRVNAALNNQTTFNLNTTQSQINGFSQQQFFEPQINNRAIPTPFAKATTNSNNFQQQPSYASATPRGFGYETTKAAASSPSTGASQTTQGRYQKISRNSDNYTPPTTPKKFSTLVPKDQYYPTTFKPATYKKQINGYTAKNEKPANYNFAAASYLPTTSTTTSFPPSQTDPDEDDGQYHPELYERDFPRHKIQKKVQKPRVTNNPQTTRYYQTPSPAVDFGEEEEFLKPAHSQNIAVGANQLRAEKTKQQQQSSLNTSSHRGSTTVRITQTTTTQRPASPPVSASKKFKQKSKDEDTSYDYAYYDTGSENPHDYSEYDVISEFGKTKRHP